ncbi:MAG: hypothetical protein RMJ55_08415 [Roseiflexaceae bacterium]|nr:hypothetical protein [Roseiflexus sp.]MDW8213566.1 hypothetical protein [Roseiflexaceae bacterium]
MHRIVIPVLIVTGLDLWQQARFNKLVQRNTRRMVNNFQKT